MYSHICLILCPASLALAATTPWLPPPAGSPALLPFLRNTSLPKLAYSTWVGWYTDGGLDETSLWAQVEAMATKLRPHGWAHILHDYGWQVNSARSNISVDRYGRLYPDWQRYPSTAVNCSADCRGGCSADCRDHTWGDWKPFVDRVHAKGIGFGVHLIHGIPKIASEKNLPILGTTHTAAGLVAQPPCATFIPDMLAINASAPGAQEYYDSVVHMWAEQGIDFIYLDGVFHDCGQCWVSVIAIVADSLRRLGNGMYLFLSGGQPRISGCTWAELSELAPYVRVGTDTIDSFGPNWGTPEYESWLAKLPHNETFQGSVEAGINGAYTREVAPAIRPHHFGDLAALLVGKVHKNGGGVPGPNYYIPSKHSKMTADEVVSYASMVAMFRSSWWPAGALSEMDNFTLALLTNDAVIRVTMMSTRTRQVPDAINHSLQGPGIVWTSDDTEESWKYVLLINLHPNTTRTTAVHFAELGLLPTETCAVLDLWSSTATTPAHAILSYSLLPHASKLLRLSGCNGQTHTVLI